MRIYLPTSAPPAEARHLAPSPETLRGLRLAVLDNGKANAGVVMRRAADALAEATGATVSLVTKKGPGGRSANAAIPVAGDVLERLVAEADLVLTGAADCGSCTAYSVHDAIELESRGRPTIVLTTTRFRPIAETMAADFGLPATRLVVFPHPLGGTARDVLHGWADAAADALTALFTGRSSVAVVAAEDRPHTVPGDALDEVRAIVQADGSDLRLVGFDAASGTLDLQLVIEDASCSECVMPAEHLERVAARLLRRTIPALRRVRISDPRLAAS